MQNLSRKQGNMAKIKEEQGCFKSLSGDRVRIPKHFCVLTCRVLNSILGMGSFKKYVTVGGGWVCTIFVINC